MRIPDDALKCVCFLSVKALNARGEEYDHFIGTGFFITLEGSFYLSIPTALPLRPIYLVTARHVLDEAKKKGYTQLYARLNKYSKGSEVVALPDEWVYPEDKAVDVAVLPYAPDGRVYEHFSIPLNWCVNSETLSSPTFKIGVGDELFVVGLFTKRHGYGRNIPIVRSGILSAMPDEKLDEPDDAEDALLFFDAYLAEIKSISGLSGSPVFILFPPGRLRPDLTISEHEQPDYKNGWFVLLLGLIRGHWSAYKEAAASDFTKDETEPFNSGIAIVTPIEEAVKVILGGRLMSERKKRIAEYLSKNAPEKDPVPLPANPTGEDEAALRTSFQPRSENDGT